MRIFIFYLSLFPSLQTWQIFITKHSQVGTNLLVRRTEQKVWKGEYFVDSFARQITQENIPILLGRKKKK